MASLISPSTGVSSWGRIRECYPRLSHCVCERCEIAKLETCSVLRRGVDLSSVSREVRLGKILVPANVELLVPTLALHHEPQLWGEEVELFKPERFSEGIAKATNDNMAAFMPFGLGPRICVGFNFAALEAKIAMSMILQRYSFTLSPGYVHSPFQYVTVRPQNGVQVILHPL